MKLSAWIGLAAVSGCLALVACSDDGDDGGTGGAAGSSGKGGSAGSGTGGSAGSATGGSAGSGTGGSSGSGTGGSAGSGTGGSAGGAATCEGCIADKCKTEDDACTADPDCVKINDCVADNCFAPDAGDFTACVGSCVTANPNGATAFQALLTCAGTNCATECGG